jgi:DNA invertase Pin-like site-specific DNA recombinase
MRWHGLLCKSEGLQMLIGYARTSTVEQVAGLEAQEAALGATGGAAGGETSFGGVTNTVVSPSLSLLGRPAC